MPVSCVFYFVQEYLPLPQRNPGVEGELWVPAELGQWPLELPGCGFIYQLTPVPQHQTSLDAAEEHRGLDCQLEMQLSANTLVALSVFSAHDNDHQDSKGCFS